MGVLVQILALAMAGFLIWYCYRFIKARPELFTLDNFNQSIRTLVILAFLLLGFLSLCVLLLQRG